mgnify:CR=1 FL=1
MQVTFGQAPGVGAQTSWRQPKFGLFKRDKAKPAAPETGAQKAPEQAKPTVAIPTVRSKEAFDAAIAGEKPVLVKFEKKDCPACQEAEPVVQRQGQGPGIAAGQRVEAALQRAVERPVPGRHPQDLGAEHGRECERHIVYRIFAAPFDFDHHRDLAHSLIESQGI